MKLRIVERINRYCGTLRSYSVERRLWWGLWRHVADADTRVKAENLISEMRARNFRGRQKADIVP